MKVCRVVGLRARIHKSRFPIVIAPERGDYKLDIGEIVAKWLRVDVDDIVNAEEIIVFNDTVEDAFAVDAGFDIREDVVPEDRTRCIRPNPDAWSRPIGPVESVIQQGYRTINRRDRVNASQKEIV